jgi:hypothetical protein
MDAVLARVVVSSGIARILWWRPRAITAREGGLVIERRGGAEQIPWTEIDAVIDVAPVLVQSRGRVVVRLDADDDDAADALVAIVVERAGLEWVERPRKGKLPRMAVRPAVAASLRSGQTGGASARMSAAGDSPDRGES